MDYVAQGDIRTKIRDNTCDSCLAGQVSAKKVKVLSGGERSRLAMIRLLLEPVNLLLPRRADKPLDMRSKDVSKNALKEFDGTVIVVSHDREFLDGWLRKFMNSANNGRYFARFTDFLEKEKNGKLEKRARKYIAICLKQCSRPTISLHRINYHTEARKEWSKAVKKLEKTVAEAEQKIADIEKSIADIEARLEHRTEHRTEKSYREYSEKKKVLSAAMNETICSWKKCNHKDKNRQ